MREERARGSRAGRDDGRPRSLHLFGVGIAIAALATLSVAAADTASGPMRAARVAQREEARVSIAATIRAVPASEIPLPIQVGPAAAVPMNSFIRVRGLPPFASLSEGHSISSGPWAVRLFALATLKVNVPAGGPGRFEIVIALLGMDGAQLAEARSALVIEDAAIFTTEAAVADPQRTIIASAPLPASRAGRVGKAEEPPHELSDDERSRREKFAAQGARYVAQGEQFLSEGNMAAARQFFRRAADAEYALGAMRLAETYDPAELALAHAEGITPDKGEARKWYERARVLGAADADARLARLDRN